MRGGGHDDRIRYVVGSFRNVMHATVLHSTCGLCTLHMRLYDVV